MTSYYTRAKRRKMEMHVGGDNHHAKHSSKQEHIPPTGSASGDFSFTDQCHQYVTIVSERPCDVNSPGTSRDYQVCTTTCNLGDRWSHKYAIPLSVYPNKPLRTGDSDTDITLVVMPQNGYRPLQIVGKGRFGTVVMAQNMSHRTSEYIPVALKIGKGKTKRKGRAGCKPLEPVEWEANILRQINHEHVISLMDTIYENNQTVLVLEFFENGTLENLLKARYARFLTEPVARRYFQQLFSAVEYIHTLNIAHRDICNQNILISQSDTIKLADFGHAMKFYSFDALCEDICGSCGYQAPEMLTKTPYNPRIADLWSLGCVLFSMTIGKMPFGAQKKEYLERTEKRVQFPDEKIMPISSELKELVTGLLCPLTHERFGLNRIKYSCWVKKEDTQLHIGNFYLIRQPQKVQEGEAERQMKELYDI